VLGPVLGDPSVASGEMPLFSRGEESDPSIDMQSPDLRYRRKSDQGCYTVVSLQPTLHYFQRTNYHYNRQAFILALRLWGLVWSLAPSYGVQYSVRYLTSATPTTTELQLLAVPRPQTGTCRLITRSSIPISSQGLQFRGFITRTNHCLALHHDSEFSLRATLKVIVCPSTVTPTAVVIEACYGQVSSPSF
jgi:hypothetical protein